MNLRQETKMKIMKPKEEIFEAFVNPEIMANYWFSGGSRRWEQGKTVTLRYDEYNAVLDINVIEVTENQKIVYKWGAIGEETVVTIILTELDQTSTVVEITETGWKEEDSQLLPKMIGNKEGWVYVLTCLKAYMEYGVSLRGALVK